MAKQKFTIAHDLRFRGKHVKAGSPIELGNDGEDAMTLNNLLASDRIVEIDAAHKHLQAAKEEPAPATPAAQPAKPAEAPKK